MHRLLLAAGVCSAASSALLPAARTQAMGVEEIARCATITADSERLACYDRLARNAPAAAQPPTTQPPAKLPPARADQAFGMTKPPVNKPVEPSRMEARVVDVSTDSHGGALVRLDNDQAWTSDEGTTLLRPGDAIVIKRGALGSFLMTTPTGRVYRVRRLR